MPKRPIAVGVTSCWSALAMPKWHIAIRVTSYWSAPAMRCQIDTSLPEWLQDWFFWLFHLQNFLRCISRNVQSFSCPFGALLALSPHRCLFSRFLIWDVLLFGLNPPLGRPSGLDSPLGCSSPFILSKNIFSAAILCSSFSLFIFFFFFLNPTSVKFPFFSFFLLNHFFHRNSVRHCFSFWSSAKLREGCVQFFFAGSRSQSFFLFLLLVSLPLFLNQSVPTLNLLKKTFQITFSTPIIGNPFPSVAFSSF